MSSPTLLQKDYSRGVVQDLARHALPANSNWKLTDYLLNHGAPLRKRGGWAYSSPALGGGLTSTEAIAFAPFAGGNQLVAISNDGHLWKVTSPASATDKGAAAIPVQRPVFFQELLIIPGATPKKYDGTAAPANLGGTPPGGLYAEAYKSRLILGGSAALPNTIWFSDVLDPQTWDTANSYIPTTHPITGLASLRNMVLVFSDGMTERIRGETPPPGGDMVREPVFQEGCIDARSIVTMGERVIWANANGVWISDGAAADNLIEQGGIQQYWTALMKNWTSSYVIAGGLINGYYHITITNGTTFVDSLALHVESKTWSFHTNMKATMFAEAYGAAPELYWSMKSADRTGALSGIYLPTSSNQQDANAVDVQPVIETVFFRGAPGSRRFKDILIGNHITVDGGSTTYLKTSVITSPEDTSYDPLCEDDGVTPIQLIPSGAYQRSKVKARIASNGIGFKIEQVGKSQDTMLFDIEATQHEREGLR